MFLEQEAGGAHDHDASHRGSDEDDGSSALLMMALVAGAGRVVLGCWASLVLRCQRPSEATAARLYGDGSGRGLM